MNAMEIEKQRTCDGEAVEELLNITFGKNRFKKAAYVFREGVAPIEALCFVIRESGKLIATLRFWPILIDDYAGLLLGPIAVSPELQGQGYGIKLMEYGLSEATLLGHSRVLLVGDEAYYQRVGFSRKLAQKITMPMQEDQSRLLAIDLVRGSFDGVKGKISSVKC